MALRGSNAKEYAAAYHYRVRACVDYNSNNVSDAGECGAWSNILSINDTELSMELRAGTADAADMTEGARGNILRRWTATVWIGVLPVLIRLTAT